MSQAPTHFKYTLDEVSLSAFHDDAMPFDVVLPGLASLPEETMDAESKGEAEFDLSLADE